MKKSAIAICGAVLAAVAFANEPAPAPECDKPAAPAPGASFSRPDRPHRGKPGRQMQRPPALVINEKTTPEQVEEYKKLVAEKIDAAFVAFKDKPVPEGETVKAPTRVMLMVVDHSFGGPGKGPGMAKGQKGPKGERPSAARRNRGPKHEGRGPKGPASEGAPEPAPEAK